MLTLLLIGCCFSLLLDDGVDLTSEHIAPHTIHNQFTSYALVLILSGE